MANGRQASMKHLKMAERAQKQRELLFPTVDPEALWGRKKNDGYTTVPRTLPTIMELIDSESKNQPAGHTLFCLWCRSPDDPLVTIENPAVFASEAGFSGERAVDTWRRRMKRLKELGFIRTHNGASGEFHYVLLMNPNMVAAKLESDGKGQAQTFAKLYDRMLTIGSYQEVETVKEWPKEKQQSLLGAQDS
jgi:hypothetical protein